MPKQTIKYASETEIPSELKAYAKSDNSVEVWVNEDDTKLAAELNPQLEANRNKILGEKDTLQTKYDALVQTSSKEDLDKAKLVAENEQLKKTTVPPEDLEIVNAVKQVFPNMSAADLAKQIPQFKDATEKVVQYEKEKHNQTVFGALGYKNQSAFLDVLQIPDMLKGVEGDIFVEQIKEGDKPAVDKAFVNVKNDSGAIEKTSWEDYTTKINPKWQLHQASLNSVSGTNNTENNTWIPQNSEGEKGGGTGKGVVESFVDKRNEQNKSATNPFIRNQPTTNPNAQVNQN